MLIRRTVFPAPANSPHGSLYHPAFADVVRYDVADVSDDPDTQVAQVIGMMRDYIQADTPSLEIQRDAQLSTETGDAIEDVFRWVQSRIDFVADEENAAPLAGWLDRYKPGLPVAEVLIRPRDMSEMCARGGRSGRGDCDCQVMYAAALLRAKGVRCKAVTIAADREQPNVWSHVYLACYVNGQRIPVDVSHGARVGWESPVRYRLQEWDLERSPYAPLAWIALAGAAVYFISRGVN